MLVGCMVLERKIKLCSTIVDNFLGGQNMVVSAVGKKNLNNHRKSKECVLVQTLQRHMV